MLRVQELDMSNKVEMTMSSDGANSEILAAQAAKSTEDNNIMCHCVELGHKRPKCPKKK